jgi:DNA mismatch endonuclease (patch repair protein)
MGASPHDFFLQSRKGAKEAIEPAGPLDDDMDTFDSKKRSWIMARVKSAGNRSTEQAFLSILREQGLTGWRRTYPVFGKPDFVFLKARVAVFVDGCFWHGHPQKCRIPKANRTYWLKKIARNRARDKRVSSTLRKKGWKVVRIWEDSIRKVSTARRLREALK